MIKANDIEMVKLGGMTPEERERYEKNKIEINKKVSSLIAEATKNAKLECCILCSKPCSSFCNSHSIPQFALKRIAEDSLETIQKKMDLVLQREDYQEEKLRYSAENLDEEAKQSSFIKRILLSIHYIGVHLEIYVQKRIRAVKYLLMLLNFKMTRLLGSLLKPSRIRLNIIAKTTFQEKYKDALLAELQTAHFHMSVNYQDRFKSYP